MFRCCRGPRRSRIKRIFVEDINLLFTMTAAAGMERHTVRRQVCSTQQAPRRKVEGGHITEKVIGTKTSSRMYDLFGFSMNDISSWSRFVQLMNRPMDPSSLGVTRFLFGRYSVYKSPCRQVV